MHLDVQFGDNSKSAQVRACTHACVAGLCLLALVRVCQFLRTHLPVGTKGLPKHLQPAWQSPRSNSHAPTAFPALTSLRLTSNALVDVPTTVAHFTALVTLDLSYNDIHTIHRCTRPLLNLLTLCLRGALLFVVCAPHPLCRFSEPPATWAYPNLSV